MYISFIAPAYKVDNYLDDFFKSFYLIKHVDFEIIVVNDDPKSDLSPWIKKFSDLNIKIINNEHNVGQGPSRLRGLKYINENASNIIFIDTDDAITNGDFVTELLEKEIVQFSHNNWFKNRLVFESCDGGVSDYKLDNVIWGVSFPREIALQIPKYSRKNESNDMPIKLRMAQDYKWTKAKTPIINYRIRKSSTINSVRSERRAKEELQTWINLMEEGFVDSKKAFDNIYFELIINKKSFKNEWYKDMVSKYKGKTSKTNRFNAIMYRTVKFWWLKNKIKNIFSFRKMFD